jgi:hypothetical protein
VEWPGDLEAADEIQIETHPGDVTRRTTIWVVVEGGAVYVRSLRGGAGHWYQELTADPDTVVHVGPEAIPVRAVAAADADSVAAATAGYRRKYADSPYVGSLTRSEVLDTTTRLEAR